MKSILVIDTPKSCRECPCFCPYYCVPIKKELGIAMSYVGIPTNFCPLKPLSTKEEIYEIIYQAYGNGNDETYQRIRKAVEDIYDEILGEEE